MNKTSSYQKLKQRNLELLADLRVLVTTPESVYSLKYEEVKHKWRIIFQTEDIIWGNRDNNGQSI